MKIQLWGSRGSLPATDSPRAWSDRIESLLKSYAGSSFSRNGDTAGFLSSVPRGFGVGYGGHTPCVEVTSGSNRLIIDAGSGLRALGDDLERKSKNLPLSIHLLFTHFHWDHVMGLPFFAPLYRHGNQIHIYAVQHELSEMLQTIFRKPFFPVPYDQLAAQITTHQVVPRRPFELNGFTVAAYQLDHPDPCWGYRIERGGISYAHCVDTECTRFSETDLGPDLPLYQNADLLVFDAQYRADQRELKKNWGHSSAALGLELAFREKTRKLVLMHHDPAHTSEEVGAMEKEAQGHYARLKAQFGRELDWEFAYDGLVFEAK